MIGDSSGEMGSIDLSMLDQGFSSSPLGMAMANSGTNVGGSPKMANLSSAAQLLSGMQNISGGGGGESPGAELLMVGAKLVGSLIGSSTQEKKTEDKSISDKLSEDDKISEKSNSGKKGGKLQNMYGFGKTLYSDISSLFGGGASAAGAGAGAAAGGAAAAGGGASAGAGSASALAALIA